ncbi:reverse transcriptase domain-containing protein [Acinetobacter sp. ME22]|uniref:reverse transcriptase domain-containing protein n=1 Tax=Acinetobacter sp. ME22 TaxID=2904802 RepID=UPI0022AAE338|nr:reverse transcriptase domain-containing protein [Acinetobacter sp. ME22]
MQALHLLALEPIAETTADRNSYGFRSQCSIADAAAQCFGVLSRKVNAEWVLEGDIQGCFDNISHDWMIAILTKHSDGSKIGISKYKERVDECFNVMNSPPMVEATIHIRVCHGYVNCTTYQVKAAANPHDPAWDEY